MNLRHSLPVLATALAAILPASADETRTKVVQFEKGKSSTVITDKITGRESVVYKLNARDKQFLKVSLRPDNQSAEYNIYIPGRGPGDEALFTSATGGREYLGQLYKSGDHSITVFLNRAAARRGETAKFDLVISVTDEKPEDSSNPGVDPKFAPAVQAGLAAVRKQVGHDRVSLLSVREGETSIIVLVKVEGAAKPWRCDYDGTKITSVEYTGEG